MAAALETGVVWSRAREEGAVRLSKWYTADPAAIAVNIRDLSLGPPFLIATLTALVVAGSAIVAVAALRAMATRANA